MPTLRSKDTKQEVKKEEIEGSPLMKWIKSSGRKSDVVAMKEVKVRGKEKPKAKEVKKTAKKRKQEKGGESDTEISEAEENEGEKDEWQEDEEDEEEEEEEEEEEWKPQKKGKSAKQKNDLKPTVERANESEEEVKGNDDEKTERLRNLRIYVPKLKKEEIEPKGEDIDGDSRNQEDVEAEQNEDAKDGQTEDADFNEYERQRQENILKNKLLLQQLQLDSVALGSKRNAKLKPPSKSTPRRKKEPSVSATEHLPRRQSSRIAGLPADSEKAKRRYEEQTAALEQAERAKRQRVGGNVTFAIGGIDFSVKGVRFAKTFTDEDVENTDNKDIKKLREKMMGLKLYERWAPSELKITPERIYYLGFHPTTDKQLVFAGDKIGTLGVWDASSSRPDPDADEDEDEQELPVLNDFKIHSRTISSFVFSPFSMNTILTASYDSSIRSLDLSKGLSTELYVGQDEEGISGVEFHDDNPYLVYFSTLTGRVGRKDTRFAGKADVWQLSVKKIGGFSMHPQHTHLCVTASLDKTMKIWDLRKIVNDDDDGQRPALIGEHSSRLSVSSAYWNRNGSIATTSYDDTVKIYRFPNSGSWAPGLKIPKGESGGTDDGEVEPVSVIRHNNQTGRWVTILRAQWQQNPRDGADKLVIGNMERFLDIYAENGTQLAQLGDESISAVPATAQFHPTENWVAGGTASGKVALFS